MKAFGKWGMGFLMILLQASAPFDGNRFENPEKNVDKKFSEVLELFFFHKRGEWPDWVQIKQYDKPPDRVIGSELRVSFVNHATVLLQSENLNILTDPVWSERVSPVTFIGPKRVHAPGITFLDLPPIDYVLISHNHYDHLDLETVRKLEKAFKPVFLVGLKVAQNMRSTIDLLRNN